MSQITGDSSNTETSNTFEAANTSTTSAEAGATSTGPGEERSPAPQRTWTEIGNALFDRQQAHRAGHAYASSRLTLATAIAALSWQEVGDGLQLPFTPGEAIRHLVQELSLPRVSRIAWNGALAVRDDVEHATSSYGVYGIEANYTDGRTRFYVVDRGTDLLPVASDFWPTPTLQAQREQ